ncbi:MAG: phosphate acyltransferase, partial [bacterium]
MDYLNEIWNRAKKLKKRIVLPESYDPRILKATDILLKGKLMDVTLIGNGQKLKKTAEECQCNIDGAKIEDIETSGKLISFAEDIYMKRKSK